MRERYRNLDDYTGKDVASPKAQVSHDVDASRRVAKRRALRLLFNEYGLGCLSIQLGTMNTEQLDAMAKLMGSYQTISAM